MKIIEDGQKYQLDLYPFGTSIISIHGLKAGTSEAEIIRTLIAHCKFNEKITLAREYALALEQLRSVLYCLEIRAAKVAGEVLPLIDFVRMEHAPYCFQCGHIFCKGGCKACPSPK